MHTPRLYPLRFEPIYKDYVWGGGRIPRLYHRQARVGTSAESWEITDRPEGVSVVKNGPLAGRTLHELVERFRADLTGSAAPAPAFFPLLVKIIDAGQRLSLQVHPDEASAARHGGQAKTEMWYVLGAEAEARVFAGLDRPVTETDFRRALADQQLEPLLWPIPLRAGEVVFVPGGRLHAVDQGCLLLEVQQNSDTTYRVFDWGRLGADGRPRPLHLEPALRVTRWDDVRPAKSAPREMPSQGPNRWWDVLRCAHFAVRRVDLAGAERIPLDGRSFHALFVVSGGLAVSAESTTEHIAAGTSCLLPASLPACTLTPAGGGAQVLVSSLV